MKIKIYVKNGMSTQTPLDGPGLEWAHNLLVLVGLVFPTKGCF